MRLAGPHHSWFYVTGALSLGDILVALGTLLLAFFTWRLASATSKLDERTATREEHRRERELRGICRLIDGELEVVQGSIEKAFGDGHWDVTSRTPHDAWDRNAALLLTELPIDEGRRFTNFY
ncbi:MAG: hypothetical protein ACLP8S_15235 [Solirubrobacteraceae bacterium]